MAEGLRLQIEYKDLADVTTIINVWQEGYTGDTAYVDGEVDPLIIKWGDASNPFQTIYGSSAEFRFPSNTDRQFVDLFTANGRKNRVEALKAGVLFWTGFGVSEFWKEPLIAPPYAVQYEALDQLGALKNEAFTDGAGDAYTGRKTPLEILAIILAKTGLNLDINTAIDLRESTQATGADPLTQTKIDVDIYAGLSCYEILTDLFKTARIQQRGGKWWVISFANFSKASVTYYTYNSAGVYQSTGTFNPVTSDFGFEGTPGTELLPALKQVALKQDYGYRSNILTNGNFDEIDSAAWVAVGVSPEIRSLNEDGDKFVYLPGKQKPADPADLTYGYKQTLAIGATADNVAFKTKFALMGTEGKSAYMYMMIKLVTATTTYWVRQFGDMATKTIVYDWAEWLQPAKPYITMNFHYSDDLSYNINPDKVPAYPWNVVPDKFQELTINIEGIPEAGNLTIMLFVAYTDDVTIAGSCWTGVNLQLKQEGQDNWETSKTLVLINNRENNEVPDDIEILHGTVPQINNRDIIYRGGITLAATGASAVNFKVDGDATTYDYAQLIGRYIASNIRSPREEYRATFTDILPTEAIIIEDAYNPGKKFIESGISYNDRDNKITGSYFELLTLDLTAADTGPLVVDETTDYTVNSSSPKIKDSDEKVAIIDANGVEVLAPSKLYNKYFQSEITEAGTVAIKTKDRLIQRNYIDPEITEEATTVDPAATGNNAVAIGEGNTAYNYGEVVTGHFATISEGSQTAWVATDRAWAVGVGADEANRAVSIEVFNDKKVKHHGKTYMYDDVFIEGDIYQNGAIYDTHAEHLFTTKDFINLRDGAVAPVATGEISGIKILLADGVNNLVLGAGSDAIARVGWEGDTLQAIATRDDVIVNNHLIYYDSADYILRDAGYAYTDVVMKTTTITGNNGLTGGGDLSANRTISHGGGSWVAKTALSGANVISNLSVDSYGHLTDWTTREMTYGDVGAAAASGSTNYIQNQSSAPQSANMWIDGTIKANRAAIGGNYYNHVLVAVGNGDHGSTEQHQVAFWTPMLGNSYASGVGSFVCGFEAGIGTVAGSYTLEAAANFAVASMDKGEGTTINRGWNFQTYDETACENHAVIAPGNDLFTGQWFIHYPGARNSYLGGKLQLGGNLEITRTLQDSYMKSSDAGDFSRFQVLNDQDKGFYSISLGSARGGTSYGESNNDQVQLIGTGSAFIVGNYLNYPVLLIQNNAEKLRITNTDLVSSINFVAPVLQMTTGAASGYLPISSADGIMSWTAKSSINISEFTNDLGNYGGFLTSETDPVWNSEKSNYYTISQSNVAYASAFHNHAGIYEPAITKTQGYAYWNAGTASWAFSDLNSYGWYLYVNGISQKTVAWGSNVKFAAGINISLDYASDTITINNTYSLTKFEIESLLTGVITSHAHNYLSANENITISGSMTGSGQTSISLTPTAALVTGRYAPGNFLSTDALIMHRSGSIYQGTISELQTYMQANLTFGSGGTPGGTSGQIQYNNSGSFGGFGDWNGSTASIYGNLYIDGNGTFYDYSAQSYFKIDNSVAGQTNFYTGESASAVNNWLQVDHDATFGATIVLDGNIVRLDGDTSVTIHKGILDITPVASLPSVNGGRLCVTDGLLYFSDGTTWYEILMS